MNFFRLKSKSAITFKEKKLKKIKKGSFYQNDYYDYEFPPYAYSVSPRISKTYMNSIGLQSVEYWLRPHEVMVNPEDMNFPVSLIFDPKPRDVIQGNIGSCWLISALAAIAQRPELLLKIIPNYYYNPSGYHEVVLCIRGEWKTVSIDDYLPCDAYGRLVFAYGRYRQFWVSLVEKALAKIYGSYEAIAVGTCAEGLQTLTGESCEQILLEKALLNVKSVLNKNQNYENPRFLWSSLLFYKSVGYLMTILCNSSRSAIVGEVRKNGLINEHIYTILEVREFTNKGKIECLVKLRNPWGHSEWNGAWSNNWPYWPEEVINQIPDPDDMYNGSFWISFNDILKYFHSITICKARSDMIEYRFSSSFYDYLQGAEVYALEVYETGQFEIQLFSTERKYTGFDRNKDSDVDLCLVVCKLNNPKDITSLSYVAFEQDIKYYLNCSLNLAPGYYHILPTSLKGLKDYDYYTSKTDPNYQTFNIVVQGSSDYSLKSTILPPESVADMFSTVAIYQNQYSYYLDNNVLVYQLYNALSFGVCVENLSNRTVKLKTDLTDSVNYGSTRFHSLTDDILPPKSRQIVNFLYRDDFYKVFQASYKIKARFLEDYEMKNIVYNNKPIIPPSYSGLHALRATSAQNFNNFRRK